MAENVNNPLAKPTVVLGQGAHMGALADSFNTIINNMKVKAQIEEAKRAELDKSLIPPDVDWDNIYHQDTEYIKGLVDQYNKKATDYWSKGVNHMRPGSGDAYKEMRKLENDILSAAAQSAQDKKIDENVITTMTKKGFADQFDMPVTMERLAEFRNKPLTERRDYLNTIGGFYTEAPFDWNKFTSENLPELPDVLIEDKKTSGGVTEWKEVKTYSPETIGKIADSWLNDPKYFRYAAGQYNSLSDQTRAQIEAEAQKQGISGIQLYARFDAERKNFRQEDLQMQKKGGGSGGSGSGNTLGANTFDLAIRVAAINKGAPSFFSGRTMTYGGFVFDYADIPMMKFGQYKDINISNRNAKIEPKLDAAAGGDQGTPSMTSGGQSSSSPSMSNAMQDNYLEAVVRNRTNGEIWVSTTETNRNSLGVKDGDGRYWVKANDRFWTDFLNGAVNGTEYSKASLDKFITSKNALKADGTYNFDALYQDNAPDASADDMPETIKK